MVAKYQLYVSGEEIGTFKKKKLADNNFIYIKMN